VVRARRAAGAVGWRSNCGCSGAYTSGGEAVSAFGGFKQVADLAGCLPEGIDDPDGRGAEKALSFVKGALIEFGSYGAGSED
jgi:hypothetical protein